MTDDAERKLRVIRLPDDFVEQGYRAHFGETAGEAQARGVCVNCKKPPTFTTEAGRREFGISGLCEPCWDLITMPPDERA